VQRYEEVNKKTNLFAFFRAKVVSREPKEQQRIIIRNFAGQKDNILLTCTLPLLPVTKT
jgi:hypothetical protein